MSTNNKPFIITITDNKTQYKFIDDGDDMVKPCLTTADAVPLIQI